MFWTFGILFVTFLIEPSDVENTHSKRVVENIWLTLSVRMAYFSDIQRSRVTGIEDAFEFRGVSDAPSSLTGCRSCYACHRWAAVPCQSLPAGASEKPAAARARGKTGKQEKKKRKMRVRAYRLYGFYRNQFVATRSIFEHHLALKFSSPHFGSPVTALRIRSRFSIHIPPRTCRSFRFQNVICRRYTALRRRRIDRTGKTDGHSDRAFTWSFLVSAVRPSHASTAQSDRLPDASSKQPAAATTPVPFLAESPDSQTFGVSMIMAWQPQEEGLRQIIQLLKQSQSPDTVIQRTVQQVSFFFTVTLRLFFWRENR